VLRLVQNFNPAWKFYLGDRPGAEEAAYDDSSWSDVGLPHTFSLPYFGWKSTYYGTGWYRKHLNVPAEWSDKRVSIEFQGSFQDTQVFVNGSEVGRHLGGFNGFSYDITPNLQAGDNVIAVRVNNDWNAQVAPRGGDHQFDGGIYRNVFVVVTDPLHVTWYGTWVTTPDLATTAGAASPVHIQTEIRNDGDASTECTLTTDIVDANGLVVTTVTSAQTVAPGTTAVFEQTTPDVQQPSLWHPDHPSLYRAISTVARDGVDVDTFSTTFGFRYFSWTAEEGFSLNGSRFYFHGANVHQDHAGWGNGVTDSALHRDVAMVKEAGFDFIRGSHYPKAPAFADACDEEGVIFWSENCFWGSAAWGEGSFNDGGAYPSGAGDQEPFEQNVLQSLADMIRIHRNHPSIVVWSVSNEPYFTADSTMDRMRGLLTKQVDLAHELDPTRPAAVGGVQRPTGDGRIDRLGDVAGYNGDGAKIEEFMDPGVPNMVTEYGVWSGTRPGLYDPNWGDSIGAYLTDGFPTEFPWRGGQAIWCMFDHGTIKGDRMTTPNIGTMGIVDYFRVPKRQWYWYRNAYAGVPPPAWPAPGTPAGLSLTASTTELASVDGTEDAHLLVTVVDASGTPISNNVPVTLTIQSGPGEFPTGPRITFVPVSDDAQSDIYIMDGQAAIEFRTYYSGTTVIEASSPGLASDTLTITSRGTPAWQEGTTPAVQPRPYRRY